VAFPQRFGGALNLHVHFHVVQLDVVYAKDDRGNVVFHASRAPAQTEIASIAAEVGRRVRKLLRRRGWIRDKPDDGPDEEQSALDACMQVGLSRGEFARLDEQVDDASRGDDDARFEHRKRSPWSAEADGFSVHAGVQMRRGDAEGRERLVRYCARPALSLERLSVLRDGRVAYRTKYPRRGGRTHLVMEPTPFLARIAALIPPPKFPLVRYSGVLAPASKWRALVVPRALAPACEHQQLRAANAPQAAANAEPSLSRASEKCERSTASAASPSSTEAATSSAPSAPMVVSSGPVADVTSRNSRDKLRGRRSTSYIDWATLMKHSMGIDVLSCPKCASTMKPVAVITEPEVIRKILVHLRLPLRPELLDDRATVVYDVTGEPVLDERWRPGEDGEWGTDRGPPREWDCVDAPSPAE